MRVVTLAAAGIGLLLASEQAARAQGTLNVYCSAQIEWCQALATGFQATSGVRVNMTQKGSGEALAQIRAEAQNPRGDIWFGGTGDPHLSAAEEGLSQPYQSPLLPQLQDWAQKQAAASGYKTVGVYAGVLGFGYNTEISAKKGITPPRCWADLTGPAFKGEVQMANPNSSGTAYVMIATLGIGVLAMFGLTPLGLLRGFEFVPQWWGLTLTVTYLLQSLIAHQIERRYEANMLRNLAWIVWYPVAFWMISAVTAVVALPRAVFLARAAHTTWVSPDRGLR